MDTGSVAERRLDAPRLAASVAAPSKPPEGRSGIIPLVVGVTGHRDLRDADRVPLEAKVRELFDELQVGQPGRPIVLLTAIAEGADTLVTRVALDIGAQLVVVLPFPRQEYEQDFNGRARDDFVRLHDEPRVVRRVVIPPAGDTARVLEPDARRALQYALAGAYVAHHSDVLIALWDGLESERVGGTSQVVHYRRAGSYDVDERTAFCLADAPAPFGLHVDLLEPPDVGPVHHILTPRRSEGTPAGAFTLTVLLPYSVSLAVSDVAVADQSYTDGLADIETQIQELNSEARHEEERHRDAVAASSEQLYPDAPLASGERLDPLPPNLASLRRQFAVTDALAVRYQRSLNRALVALFLLIFVAAAAFAVFTHGMRPDGSSPASAIAIYALLLAAADVLFLFIKGRRWQDKYQDYRAVAEGLRVQFYWRLAGLEHSVSDYYVHKQRDELSWIPRAVRACSGAAAPARHDQLDSVHRLWAEAQASYYNRARRQAQSSLKWRRLGSGAIAMGLVIGFRLLWRASRNTQALRTVLLFPALVLLVHALLELRAVVRRGHSSSESGGSDPLARLAGGVAGLLTTSFMLDLPMWVPSAARWIPADREHWLLIALGVAALAGALLHAHAQVRAFAEHARRYGRLAAVFRRASNRLRAMLDAGARDQARDMVVELGKESLTDHGDWLLLHRERPIELPDGGP